MATNWPEFAAHMLRISKGEICGKLEDFVFGDWHDACTLPPEHEGKHNWPEARQPKEGKDTR